MGMSEKIFSIQIHLFAACSVSLWIMDTNIPTDTQKTQHKQKF